MNNYKIILPIIVFAQFCCTSIWFASNAVMGDLIHQFNLNQNALGHLTSSVQFGFITGTLTFAILMISDRFSPSKVFFLSALTAAIFNGCLILDTNNFMSLFMLRFLAGFSLAGIYPVGMKIAADYFEKSLGKALGYLVGALVLGTAFPHFLKGSSIGLTWIQTVLGTSVLSIIGGCLMFFSDKDGPFRKRGKKIDLKAFFRIFQHKPFKAAAIGYFGHMWELYAFWAFVPIIVTFEISDVKNPSIISFYIIAIGSISCIIGGYLSQKIGSYKTAVIALSISTICCLISPLVLLYFPFPLRIFFLLIWGMFVIADSPMFSSLVAANADPELKGSALTIVNCIGFAMTIISIQLLTYLFSLTESPFVFILLGFGGLLGLYSIKEKVLL